MSGFTEFSYARMMLKIAKNGLRKNNIVKLDSVRTGIQNSLILLINIA